MAAATKKKVDDAKAEVKEAPEAKTAPKEVEAKAEPKAPTAIFPPFHELIMLIYGDQGTGKTSFFGRSGAAFILACEPGAEFLPGQSRRVENWEAFVDLVAKIEKAKLAGQMASTKIVVVDTIDRLHRYACKAICAKYGGVDNIADIPHGKGWALPLDWISAILWRLMAVVPIALVSHAVDGSETVESESGVKKEVDKRKPSVDKRIAGWIAGEQNLVGYTYKALGEKYLIKFHADASLETKDRPGLLASYGKPFPTNWAAVEKAYNDAAKAANIELRSKWK